MHTGDFRTKRKLNYQAFFQPLTDAIDRNRLWRLTNPMSQFRWTVEEAKLLSRFAASHCQFDEKEVLDHLLDGSVTRNPSIVQLTRTRYFREGGSNMRELNAILGKYDYQAKQILSVGKVMPVRFVGESAREGHVRAQQEDLGFSDELAAKKVEFAEGRYDDFMEHYNPDTRNVARFLKSGFDDMISCKGEFRHYGAEGVSETIDVLVQDAMKVRRIDVGIIDDSKEKLGVELEQWVSSFDGILAIDNRFVMKIFHGGALRIFHERTGEPSEDVQLERELAMLHRVLDDRYLTHASDRPTAIRTLRDYGSNVERDAEMIRREHERAREQAMEAAETANALRRNDPRNHTLDLSRVWLPSTKRWSNLKD
jgi:hypothetical protein